MTDVTQSAGQAIAKAASDRLNVRDAAAHIGLAAQTLNKMRMDGRGPRYLRLGSRVFYRRKDLDAYLEQSVVETTDSRQRVA